MSYKFKITPQKTDRIETKHRRIVTDIPAPSTINIINNCIEYEPYSMNNQLPVVWDSAVDYQIFDNAGNYWIDFTSTIFVSNIGNSNKKVLNAIDRAIQKPLINAYYYPTKERAILVKFLAQLAPEGLEKVLILTTGSEAVEAAIKMMRINHQKNNLSIRQSYIIGFEKSFHGKTMGAQMVGGKIPEKRWIGYQHPEILHLPFPYPWILKDKKMTGKIFFENSINELLNQNTISQEEIAGFICEPYQGWCAIFYPKDYMQALSEWCKKNGSLLAIDEIQSGFGRTGKLFAFEHFEIIPDIIICGKAISSGLPLSAIITKEKITNNCDESFNSTHGGNPLICETACVCLMELIDNNLILESKIKGKILLDELNLWKNEMPDYIKQVYGKGLLASVFIENPANNNDQQLNNDFVDFIIETAMQKGLLSIRTGSGTLKIGPPLTIPSDALLEGIDVLKESLNECIKKWKQSSGILA